MGIFTSVHFRLHRLAEGVFAAIHSEGGWAQSNAGIVDLGDRVLIFDTFIAPEAANDLRSAAAALLSRPISAVINSHYHNDHIWGNQAFPDDVPIISTRKLAN
jgi:cyclase